MTRQTNSYIAVTVKAPRKSVLNVFRQKKTLADLWSLAKDFRF